jgi:hypothetical protein
MANGKSCSARVEILARPGDVLAAFLARAAVTTGRSTTNRANEFLFAFARLFYFLGKKNRAECKKTRER